MSRTIPRIMIAGVNSGSGKTTITCGILQMLKNRGLRPVAFKCGPDYIDPMFHKSVLGVDGTNLDLFLFPKETARYLLQKNMEHADIAVIEGVMGLYDGIGADGTDCSTYDVAKTVKAPTILIVPCNGMSYSALAMVKGFIDYKKDSNIQGIIFNHMHPTTFEELKKLWEPNAPKLLGYINQIPKELQFKSRHLGLVTALEIDEIQKKLMDLANHLQLTIDLDGIIELAQKAEDFDEIYTDQMVYNQLQECAKQQECDKQQECAKQQEGKKKQTVRVAIAMDQAFCFYYKDNLQLFEDMGMELAPFSPVKDSHLPESICGIILGGGYPELYLEQLSANTTLKQEIHRALMDGMPCIAECGGFMYLNESIDGYPMVGFLKSSCSNQSKLVRFGYTTLTAKKDNLLCKAGEQLRGHEFHYYDCKDNGDSFLAAKKNGTVWDSVIANDTLYAGYPHLHFYSNPQAAYNYYLKCLEYASKE